MSALNAEEIRDYDPNRLHEPIRTARPGVLIDEEEIGRLLLEGAPKPDANIEGRLEKDRNLTYEGLFTGDREQRCRKRSLLNNGYLTRVETWTGNLSGTQPLNYVSGSFEKQSLGVPKMPEDSQKIIDPEQQSKPPSLLNLPDYLAFGIKIGQQEAYPDNSTLQRSLDQEHGTLTTNCTLVADGNKANLEVIQFLDMLNPHQAVMKIKITPHGNSEVTISTGIDGSQPDPDKCYKNTRLGKRESGITYTAQTASNNQIAIAQRTKTFDGNGQELQLPRNFKQVGDNFIWQEQTLNAEQGHDYETVVVSQVYTKRDPDLPTQQNPEQLAAEAAQSTMPGYAEVLQGHNQSWEEINQETQIIIEGDPEAQFALNFNSSRIQAAMREGFSNGAPGAKIGNECGKGYGGKVFWDTLWLVKNMRDEVRRTYFEYRYKLLPAAHKKNRKISDKLLNSVVPIINKPLKGAFALWEAAFPEPDGGDGECGPEFIYNNIGDLVPIESVEQSVHSSADDAFGVMDYYNDTKDEAFLRDYGTEIVMEAAMFLASRAYKREDGKYEYRKVTGPDEYHPNVTNNAYTLLMAAYTLDEARKLLDNGWVSEDLRKKIGLEEADIAALEDMRANLYIPFDPDTLIFNAFDGWETKIHVKLADYGVPQMDVVFLELQAKNCLPEGINPTDMPISQTDIIKQSDTILALTFLGNKILGLLPPDVLDYLHSKYPGEDDDAIMRRLHKANYDKYARQTSGGSSLEPSIRSLAALNAGIDPDECYQMYKKSLYMDLSAEDTHDTGAGLHTANMGGSLKVAVEGFMGIKIDNDFLTVNPRMPTRWETADHVVSCFGQKCKVKIDQNQNTITVELLNPSEDSKIPIKIIGTEYSPLGIHNRLAVIPLNRQFPLLVALDGLRMHRLTGTET